MSHSEPPSTPRRVARPTGQRISTAEMLAYGELVLRAFTDFSLRDPVTIPVDAPLTAALNEMRRSSVNALLVTEADSPCEVPSLVVVGMVTIRELQGRGERSMRFPCSSGEVLTEPLRVGDCMTPWCELTILEYSSLRVLTVAALSDLLDGTGLTHLPVVEKHPDSGAETICGLVSRASLIRRLKGVRARGRRWSVRKREDAPPWRRDGGRLAETRTTDRSEEDS